LNEGSESRESRSRVEKLVGQLLDLARDNTACEILGVSGVLAGQVDISFLEDPIDYVAYDLAAALMAADDDDNDPSTEVPPLLATLVAEVKLWQSVQGQLDEHELVRRTLSNLRG
jgi:hypothetical protein